MDRKTSDGFALGVAWAVAVCMRLYQEGAGEMLAHESGLTLADFEKAGAEEYDLSQVRKALLQY